MERIELASKLLLASPPGELEDVLNDVRVIIDDDELLQEHIPPYLNTYHIQNHTTVDMPNASYKVVLSKYNQLDNDAFFDPISKQEFQYDSLQKIVQLSEHVIESSESLEPFREAMQTSVNQLIQDYYTEGHASVCVNEQAIMISLVHDKANRSSYWSGKWLGDWRYDFQEKVLVGMYQIKVHYFEDGNVQLLCSRQFHYSMQEKEVEDPLALANEIKSCMKTAGDDIQTSIDHGFTNLADHTFKGLRRALPMSKTKIDWDKILAYRMGNAIPIFGLKKQQN